MAVPLVRIKGFAAEIERFIRWRKPPLFGTPEG